MIRRDIELEPVLDKNGRKIPDELDWTIIPASIAMTVALGGIVGLLSLAASLGYQLFELGGFDRLSSLAISTGYKTLFLKINGMPTFIWITVILALIVVSGLFFVFRDIRNWRSLAIAQIFIGAIYGAILILPGGFSVNKIIGVISAVITIANGFKALNTIAEAKAAIASNHKGANRSSEKRS